MKNGLVLVVLWLVVEKLGKDFKKVDYDRKIVSINEIVAYGETS